MINNNVRDLVGYIFGGLYAGLWISIIKDMFVFRQRIHSIVFVIIAALILIPLKLFFIDVDQDRYIIHMVVACTSLGIAYECSEQYARFSGKINTHDK